MGMSSMQILLRDLEESDLDKVLRWRNDPAINKYLTNQVKSENDARVWFTRSRSNPINLLKAIICDGRTVGYCMVNE
jgi:hypothetical protein